MNTFWEFEAFTTKDKKMKFWRFLGPRSPKMGPRIKLLVQQFFGHGKVSTIWAFENSSSTTEGRVLFSNFGPFRALLGHSPKTGLQIKILVQQFFRHDKVILFWRHEIHSSKTVVGVPFLSFGPFWARFGPLPENRGPNQHSVPWIFRRWVVQHYPRRWAS